MSREVEQVLADALRLSAEDRGQLIADLIASLDEHVDADAEAAWSDEIRKRVNDLRSGRVETTPWQDVHRELRDTLEGLRGS